MSGGGGGGWCRPPKALPYITQRAEWVEAEPERGKQAESLNDWLPTDELSVSDSEKDRNCWKG